MNFFRALLLVMFAGTAHAQAWETATPESQGMDSAALARLVEYGGNVRMDSLVIVRNGRVVAEAYYAPYRADMLHRINSSTKAVVGALAGIAIARGDFPAVSTPVQALLTRAPPAWQSMTVQHLLDMTTGIDWNEPLGDGLPVSLLEMERSSDWEKFVTGRALKQAPGVGFDYNSGASHLLAVAIARKAGTPLETYARQHLFTPLGITAWRWRQDPQSNSIGGFGLYLHTRDMARLGELYLRGGEWHGRQVVPREWVQRVFTPKVEMPFPGHMYADYWWSLPKRGAYFMAGFNRQVVMVLPGLGVVAAFTGRMNWPIDDVIRHLERAVKSTDALPADAAAHAALQERIASVAAEKVTAASAPAQLPFTRATWKLDDNRAGIRELMLDFSAAPQFHVKLRTREFGGPLGMDGRFGAAQDGGTAVFTTARWATPDTLEVEQRWPEEAGAMHYTLKFKGNDMEFTHVNQFGVRGTERARRID